MVKRSVKSLHQTGRVSRKRASMVAKQLRAELDSGTIKTLGGKKITRNTTASGRGAIAFSVVLPKQENSPHAKSTRKTLG